MPAAHLTIMTSCNLKPDPDPGPDCLDALRVALADADAVGATLVLVRRGPDGTFEPNPLEFGSAGVASTASARVLAALIEQVLTARSLASDMTGELAANLDRPYDEDAPWQAQWARLRDEALRLVHVTRQPCAACGAVVADERESSGDTHPWTESLEALKEALDGAHRRRGALAIVRVDENGAVCPGDDDLSFFADLENTTGTELLIEWAYERHRCALGTGDQALAQFLELRLAEAEARAHRQAMLAQLWRRQWAKAVAAQRRAAAARVARPLPAVVRREHGRVSCLTTPSTREGGGQPGRHGGDPQDR